MYLVLVYDIEQRRVAKVCKCLRRHLNWVQNSVFEGEISEASLRKIESELHEIINPAHDSVLMYCIQNPKGWQKRVLGIERLSTDTII